MSPCTVLEPHGRQASDVRGQSGAEPDVRVDVRPRVVAVRSKHAGVGTVVPVAAATHEPSTFATYPQWDLFSRLHPTSEHLSDLVQLLAPNLIFSERKVCRLLICSQSDKGA